MREHDSARHDHLRADGYTGPPAVLFGGLELGKRMNEEGTMLLDELMPRYDVVERHRIIVRAAPEVVFRSIREADLAGGPATRALLALRALPALITALSRSPRAARMEYAQRSDARRHGIRFQNFERAGFKVVAERVPYEVVIGLLGRFWTLRGGLRAVSADSFRAGPPEGMALAGWNFTVTQRPDLASELRTETRVKSAADSRWKFLLYWFTIRAGSGLIRRAMLQAIKRHAEGTASRS